TLRSASPSRQTRRGQPAPAPSRLPADGVALPPGAGLGCRGPAATGAYAILRGPRCRHLVSGDEMLAREDRQMRWYSAELITRFPSRLSEGAVVRIFAHARMNAGMRSC